MLRDRGLNRGRWLLDLPRHNSTFRVQLVEELLDGVRVYWIVSVIVFFFIGIYMLRRQFLS